MGHQVKNETFNELVTNFLSWFNVSITGGLLLYGHVFMAEYGHFFHAFSQWVGAAGLLQWASSVLMGPFWCPASFPSSEFFLKIAQEKKMLI